MRLAMVVLAMSGALMAQQTASSISTETQRMSFPTGGTLHVKNSSGDLTIEAWDSREMELTTTKSVHLALDPIWTESSSQAGNLAQARVTAERHGNEILVTTVRRSDIDLAYDIHVPRDAKVIVEHAAGEVHVDGVANDIQANVSNGLVLVRLPPESQYGINARTRLGDVISDFPGRKRRRPWIFAHRFETSAPAHKLFLRTGWGDIIILKIRRPAPPAPLTLR